MEKKKIKIKSCATCGALKLGDKLHTACMLCDDYSNWFEHKEKGDKKWEK